MHFINDIPEGEHRERLRREVLDGVAERRENADTAFSRMNTYMGIIISGSTIAILGFIGQQLDEGVPFLAVVSLVAMCASMIFYCWLLYLQYQLHNARYNLAADNAQKFFMREKSLEDVMAGYSELRSTWRYRLLFWLPICLLVFGYAAGILGLCGIGGQLTQVGVSVPLIEIKVLEGREKLTR